MSPRHAENRSLKRSAIQALEGLGILVLFGLVSLLLAVVVAYSVLVLTIKRARPQRAAALG